MNKLDKRILFAMWGKFTGTHISPMVNQAFHFQVQALSSYLRFALEDDLL